MIFTATLTGGANVLEEIFVTDDMPAQYQNVLRPLITSKDIRFALWLWGSKHYVMYEELTVREKLLYQEDKEKIRVSHSGSYTGTCRVLTPILLF